MSPNQELRLRLISELLPVVASIGAQYDCSTADIEHEVLKMASAFESYILNGGSNAAS
jgi:hypothetical protein